MNIVDLNARRLEKVVDQAKPSGEVVICSGCGQGELMLTRDEHWIVCPRCSVRIGSLLWFDPIDKPAA